MDRSEELQIAPLQAQLKAHRRRLESLQEKQALQGINTPPETRIEIEDIQQSIAQIAQKIAHLGVATNAQPLNNLPSPSYDEFVPRPAEYDKVEQRLRGSHPLVAVWGQGGTGKTSLAREIARDCLKGRITRTDGVALFNAVVWLKEEALSSPDHFDVVLNTIADTLDYKFLPRSELYTKKLAVHEWLRRQKVLIVIDGYEAIDNEQFFEWLLDIPEESKALVTSRELRPELIHERPFELLGMDVDEALLLTEQILQDEAQTYIDRNQLKKLIVAAGGNPQAIKVALCSSYPTVSRER